MNATTNDIVVLCLFVVLFALHILDIRRRIRIDKRGEVAIVLLWAICKKLGLDAALSGEKSTKQAVSDAIEDLDGGPEEELPDGDEAGSERLAGP